MELVTVYSAGYQHDARASRPAEAEATRQRTQADDLAWFVAHPAAHARLRAYVAGEFYPAHSAAWRYVLVRTALVGLRVREPLTLDPLTRDHDPIRLLLAADGETVVQQVGGMPQPGTFAAPRQARRRDTFVEPRHPDHEEGTP